MVVARETVLSNEANTDYDTDYDGSAISENDDDEWE